MVSIANHSGHCCGVNVMWGFAELNKRQTEERKKLIFDQFDATLARYKGAGQNICVEACLTDGQMHSGWAEVLKKAGFKHVHRFRNSNSGNYVNMLVYNRARIRKPRPFKF